MSNTYYIDILTDIKQKMQVFEFDGSSGGYFTTIDAWQPELTRRTNWASSVPFLGIEVLRRELTESNPQHELSKYYLSFHIVIAWPSSKEVSYKLRLLGEVEGFITDYLSSAIQVSHNNVFVKASDLSGEPISFGALTDTMIDSYGASVISVDLLGVVDDK